MLTHKGTRTINTERLVLRQFTVNDAQKMFENWANDEKVARYLTWCPHKSFHETRTLLEIWCSQYEREDTYNWLIDYNGTPIGNISIVRLSEKHEYVELGYCLGNAYWNQGFMTEAVKAVIKFLFTEVGINRVGISHVVDNPASGRVAQKCGLTYEGRRKEYCKISSGKILDTCDYGITRSEWINL